MVQTNSNLKAFSVTIKQHPDVLGWYSGETASRARYIAFLDISDMRPSVKIIDINVKRDPSLDHLAQQTKRPESISVLALHYLASN